MRYLENDFQPRSINAFVTPAPIPRDAAVTIMVLGLASLPFDFILLPSSGQSGPAVQPDRCKRRAVARLLKMRSHPNGATGNCHTRSRRADASRGKESSSEELREFPGPALSPLLHDFDYH